MSKNFVITGGSSNNKGAQAMVFAVAQNLKQTHPDSEIYMLSTYQKEGNEYNFNCITTDWVTIYNLFFDRFYVFKPYFFLKKRNRTNNVIGENELHKILAKTETIYDVSGFSLSSQFGFMHSLSYLLKLAIAKKYNCNIILLPQSFGPFNYNYIQKLFLFPLMKHYLQYPSKIFVRESQGYYDLKKFTSNNIYKSLDVVLQTAIPQSSTIYKKNHSKKTIDINTNNKNLAIIPNAKLLKWNLENDILGIYRLILDIVIEKGYDVYIVRHSTEDLNFCHMIAELSKDQSKNHTSKIRVLDGNYDCIELSEIISKMDFVIASRYHSLIHAYKQGIPALVIGWASKYQEIMLEFNQESYYFDIREKIQLDQIRLSLNSLVYNMETERKSISDFMEKLNPKDLW